MILDEPYVPVAVAELDADHTRLLDGLRSMMSAAMGDIPSLEDMRAQLRRFLVAAEAHFATESALMSRLGYAQKTRHEAAHETLLALSRRRLESLRDADDLVEWVARAAHWFRDHHRDEDMRLGLAANRE